MAETFDTPENIGQEPWLPAECASDFLAVLEACTVGEDDEIGSVDSFTAFKEISLTVLCHAKLNRLTKGTSDVEPASTLARDVAACAYLLLQEQMGEASGSDILFAEDAGFNIDMLEIMDQTQIWMQMVAQPLPELKRLYAEQGIEATQEQIDRMKHDGNGAMMQYNFERNMLLTEIYEAEGIAIKPGITPEQWTNWVGEPDDDE